MNYIVQISFFIIACLGAYYTWRKDRKGVKRGQRNRLSILFGIAVVGAALALFYAVKNEKEEQENIALIQKINALQNEVLNQFTGNGSYCKLLLVNINVNNDDKALVFFSLEGKYPLRNVEARIIELNTLTQKNFVLTSFG